MGDAEGILPGLPFVFAPGGIDIPAIMVVGESKQKRTVAEALDPGIIQVGLGISEVADRDFANFLIRGLVPGDPDADIFLPGALAAALHRDGQNTGRKQNHSSHFSSILWAQR